MLCCGIYVTVTMWIRYKSVVYDSIRNQELRNILSNSCVFADFRQWVLISKYTWVMYHEQSHVQCTMYQAQSHVHCTMYYVRCTISCTMYNVHCTTHNSMYNVHCSTYNTMYDVQCSLCSVQCAYRIWYLTPMCI